MRWWQLLRWAWRDLRGAPAPTIIVFSTLFLAAAAPGLLLTVKTSLDAALIRERNALLGGEVVLELPGRPLDPHRLEQLLPEATRITHSVHTHGMLRAAGGRVLAASIKAVDAAYPLFGAVQLDPAQDIGAALAGRGAVADPLLFARLGLEPGAQVQLGAVTLTLQARLVREPDRIVGPLTLGPRLLVSLETLARSGILAPGAIVQHRYGLDLPQDVDPARFAARLRASNPDAAFRVRAAAETVPRVARILERIFAYLGLASTGFILFAALAVAIALHAHLRRRTQQIAILKSLGTTSREIALLFALEFALLAVFGAASGLLAAIALAALLLHALGPWLPFTTALHLQPNSLLAAALVGPAISAALALLPLARAKRISAATLFRHDVARPARGRAGEWLILLLLVALAMALALAAVPDATARRALLFGAPLLGGTLLAAERAGRWLVSRSLRRRGPLPLRLAASAWCRPGSPLPAAFSVLAAGSALLTLVLLLHGALRTQLTERLTAQTADLFLIDIAPAERPALTRLAARFGGRLLQQAPVVRARVVAIDGVAAGAAEIARDVRWTVEGDRSLTWMARPWPQSRLVAGAWWPADYRGPPLLSIEERVARGYGVEVGDRIAFNVLGRVIEAEIANIRERIDWSRGRIDFVFILSPGVLDAAPHRWVAALALPQQREAGFLNALAEAHPGITAIPLRAAVARIRELLDRIALAAALVALLVLSGGLLVLLAAMSAIRRTQAREAVILRLLGATRQQLVLRFLAEYGLVGALAGLLGAALAFPGAWAIGRWLLPLPFTPSATALLVPWTGLCVATLASGLLSIRRLTRRVAGRSLAALAD